MGRRKIDIQYLQDDRVRKVTFCKRKGGLFKKADDLAKLCGVEVAVIIIQENDKLCTYASTMNDVDRIINRYKSLSSGVQSAETQMDKLYRELEVKRRELEDAQRQLLQERKKVEAFVGQDVQMLTVRPVDMNQMNSVPVQVPPAQPWNNNGQLQMHETSLPLPSVVMNTTTVDAGVHNGESDDEGDDAWDAQENAAKRTKLDVAAEVVASAQ